MPSEPQQWININDFTPGIRDRVTAAGLAPLGSADGAQTYDCIALPGGSLGPLPKQTATKTRAHAGILTPEDGSLRISGFHVAGPVQANRYTSDYSGDDNVELHFAYEGVTSGSTHKWFWERVRHWAGTTLDTIRDFTVTHDVSWVKADQNYRPTSFVDHRMHASDATQMGDIFVVAGWAPDDMQASENIWLIFPDPDAPTALGYEAIRTDNEVDILVSHQGRVVSLDRHVFQHGNAGYWITNDQFLWTEVNLRTSTAFGTFTQGPISGYGAMGSVSAQELIAVKHKGGAVTVSGDLDDPTIYGLPGVVSTGGALSYGIYTPVGFVYAVKDGGVHVWGGGDSSEKLSEFLDDDFYQIKPADWPNFYGKFALWKDWILTPNNYLYDTKLKSWWRLAPSNPIFQWEVSPYNSFLYGTPVSFTDGGVILRTFTLTTKVTDYRWQSNIIPISLDRRINIREITVRGYVETGESGDVDVTLYDSDGNSQSVTVTFDDDIPKLYRKNISFQGTGIKVRLDANGSPKAPVILEVNLGYNEVARVGAS